MAKQQPPSAEEGDKPVRDGDETNGKGHEANEQSPPVPEISPTPLGPGGTIPMPKMPGRKQPPTHVKVKVTEAACEGSGQLDEEAEFLLVIRARYFKSSTVPKFDGEGRVSSRDYVQIVKPTWTEDLDTFLAKNGYKIVSADQAGEAVDTASLVDIEAIRAAREGTPLD